VQNVEIGYHPKLAEELPKKLDALLAGKDLFPAELERYEKAKRKYDEENADNLIGSIGN
jgi:hypothetical protein